MPHMIDTLSYHACGGVILGGGSGEQQHLYCERCQAFIYTSVGDQVPLGNDKEANQAAWDRGDDRSPG